MKRQCEAMLACLGMVILESRSSFAGETKANFETEDTTDLSLVTEVRDIRGGTVSDKVAGVQIQVDSECSGSSECDGNGLIYENLREFFEKDGNLYGAFGKMDDTIQKFAGVGSNQYSLFCTKQEDGTYISTVYASDLTDNATIKTAVESGGESSEEGMAIHLQKLLDSSFKTEDEKPQVRSVIYDTDLYVSCKDDTLGWQTKRYSFADGGVYDDDTVDYYDSFGTDCFTYMGTDDQYHVQSYDKSWDYTVDKDVMDSEVVGDLAVFLCEDEISKENAGSKEKNHDTEEMYSLYYYRSGAGDDLKKLKQIPVTSDSVLSVNDTWLYWTVSQEDEVVVYRAQMTTGETECVCKIKGPKIDNLIAEKDYLVLTTKTEGQKKILSENDGEFEESDQAAFALNLSSKEILLLATGETDAYTGEEPWEAQAAFPTIAQSQSQTTPPTTSSANAGTDSTNNSSSNLQAISAAADRVIYSPLVISRIAWLYGNNVPYSYDWNGIDTQYSFSWGDGGRGGYSLNMDLTTGIGDYWYDNADYESPVYEGQLDFVNLTSSGDGLANGYFSTYADFYWDSPNEITWDGFGASSYPTRSEYVIQLMAEEGLGLSCVKGSASPYMQVATATYIGNSGRGKLIFALNDVNGTQVGYAVCDSYYNYYAIYNMDCTFQTENTVSP